MKNITVEEANRLHEIFDQMNILYQEAMKLSPDYVEYRLIKSSFRREISRNLFYGEPWHSKQKS